MEQVKDIRQEFKELYHGNQFVIDKSKVKMLEIIGKSFVADEETIFGNLSTEYVLKELDWYESQSLKLMEDPPLAWKSVASPEGDVNSNYGWCIFSAKNGLQYESAVLQLLDFEQSRRAIMIYTRPSMQTDYCAHGMNDFMCTNTVQLLIRDERLWYIVNQRSMDAIYGYKNDRYWHEHILRRAIRDLSVAYSHLQPGPIIFQVGSLHLYEKHFHFVSGSS